MLCQSVAVALQLWSLHTQKVPNSDTYGLGVECTRSSLTYALGAYDNSYNHLSVYAVVGKYWKFGRFSAGPFLGLVTGYKGNEAPNKYGLSPLGGLSVSYLVSDEVKASVQLIPTNGGSLTHFSVSWRIQ